MNKVFSIVWNHSLQAWTVVSEMAARRGKRKNAGKRALGAIVGGVLSTTTLAAPPANNELPTNGQVVAGQVGISQSNNTMNINQSTQQGIVNWESFNIGSDATVNFSQPNSDSATLNRVTSGGASQIFGNLNANGQVFVVNPNGVLFGQSARVDVGGLVASTLAISNEDFLAGKYQFSGDGSEGSVINQGELLGQYVAMLAPEVRNEGVVIARQGTVAMAAGEVITLSIAGEQLVDVQVSKAQFDTLVENRHLVEAQEGLVILSAQSAAHLLGQTVNTGAISAGGIVNDGGTVRLVASSEIAHSGSINVDAGENGNGGDAILLASLDNPNSRTDVSGSLSARGGSKSGNGGFIETSASDVNIARSASFDTGASQGETGQWLIDPTDFIIGVGGDIDGSTLETQLASSNVTIQSVNGNTGTNGDIFVNQSLSWATNQLTLSADRHIEINAPLSVTGGGGLNLEFGQAGSAGDFLNMGNYFISAPVDLASGTTFTTTFGNDGVTENYTVITDEAGLLAVDAGMAGNYVLGSDISVSTTPWNPLGNATGDFAFGTTGFTGIFDGLGHTIDGLTRANTNNSTGIGLFGQIGDQFASGGLVQNLGLTNVNLAGLSEVGALAGANFGIVSNVYSTGTVTGGDAVGPTNDDIVGGIGGLIGTNGGLVGLSYSSADVTATTGDQSFGDGLDGGTGGLVGSSIGGSVDSSYATGSVTGNRDVGGLIGYVDGTVTGSYASGAVSGTTNVGGLVGALFGFAPPDAISDSYWNTTTSGVATSAGGATGLTDAQAQQQSSYAGFDFTNTWVIYDGTSQPLLRGMLTPYYVAVDSQNKTYDGNTFADFTATESEDPRPGVITGSLIFSGTGTTATDAGSYTVSVSGLDLTAAAKESQQGYIIEYVDGTVTIDQAALSVTATDQNKTYGDTLTLDNAAFTSTGLVAGETIGSVSIASASGHDADTSADAGTYADDLQVSNATGGSFNAANYDITYVAGDLTIDQRAITVTANDQGKTYGDGLALDNTAFTTANLANSEQIDTVTLTSATGIDANTSADAGTYTDEIVASGVAGSNGFNSANYDITYVSGDLTVGQRALTVTANDQNKNYGDALSLDNTSFTATNLANAEQIDTVTLNSATGIDADATADAGTYTDEIVATGVSGSNGFNAANYAVTYEAGDLVVDPRAVTVTLDDQSKTYGDTLTLDNTAFIATNLVNGNQIDTVNLSSASGSDSDASADAGTYSDDIVGTGVSGSNGFNAGNYNVSYVAADLTIDQRALTVTANDQNKTYGDDLSGSSSEFSAVGLASGDNIDSVTLSGVNASDTGADVGTYANDLVASEAVGGEFNAANYAISYVNGDLTVDPALLTVTADDQSITEGDAIPELAQTISGFVNGETLGTSGVRGSGVATTTATSDSPAGDYNIASESGSLAASNYTFAFVDGTLSIDPDVPTGSGDGTETAVEIIQETLNQNGDKGTGAGGSGADAGETAGTGPAEGGSGPGTENDAIQQGANQFCDSCITVDDPNAPDLGTITLKQQVEQAQREAEQAKQNTIAVSGEVAEARQAAEQARREAESDPDSKEKANALRLANERLAEKERELAANTAEQYAAVKAAKLKEFELEVNTDGIAGPKAKAREVKEAVEDGMKAMVVALQAYSRMFMGDKRTEEEKRRDNETLKKAEEAKKLLDSLTGETKKLADQLNELQQQLFNDEQAVFAAKSDLDEAKSTLAEASDKAAKSKEAAEQARAEAAADPTSVSKALKAKELALQASKDKLAEAEAKGAVSDAETTVAERETVREETKNRSKLTESLIVQNLTEEAKQKADEEAQKTASEAIGSAVFSGLASKKADASEEAADVNELKAEADKAAAQAAQIANRPADFADRAGIKAQLEHLQRLVPSVVGFQERLDIEGDNRTYAKKAAENLTVTLENFDDLDTETLKNRLETIKNEARLGLSRSADFKNYVDQHKNPVLKGYSGVSHALQVGLVPSTMKEVGARAANEEAQRQVKAREASAKLAEETAKKAAAAAAEAQEALRVLGDASGAEADKLREEAKNLREQAKLAKQRSEQAAADFAVARQKAREAKRNLAVAAYEKKKTEVEVAENVKNNAQRELKFYQQQVTQNENLVKVAEQEAAEAQAQAAEAKQLPGKIRADQEKWKKLVKEKETQIASLDQQAEQAAEDAKTKLAAAKALDEEWLALNAEIEKEIPGVKATQQARLEAEKEYRSAKKAREDLAFDGVDGGLGDIFEAVQLAVSIYDEVKKSEKKGAAQARLMAAEERLNQLRKEAPEKVDAINAKIQKANELATRAQKAYEAANEAEIARVNALNAAAFAKAEKAAAEQTAQNLNAKIVQAERYSSDMQSYADSFEQKVAVAKGKVEGAKQAVAGAKKTAERTETEYAAAQAALQQARADLTEQQKSEAKG
jgi:filamentous hemagglutinin family protein